MRYLVWYIQLGSFLEKIIEKAWINFKIYRLKRKHISHKKHWLYRILIEDIFFVIVIVILVQQYFIQLYYVPSGSMENTVQIGDRVLADNLSYGPPILPDLPHLPALRPIQRGDIAVFDNPSFPSRGTIWKLFRKFVFFITLSLIDIERDEFNQPIPSLLVKRIVGLPGDYIQVRQGNFFWLNENSQIEMDEIALKKLNQLSYQSKRQFAKEDYQLFKQLAYTNAILTNNTNLELPYFFRQFSLNYFDLKTSINYIDNIYYTYQFNLMRFYLDPQDLDRWILLLKRNLGIYIPKDYFLMIGDNRDNSKDGRYFGLISKKNILGRIIFRVWPWDQIGILD